MFDTLKWIKANYYMDKALREIERKGVDNFDRQKVIKYLSKGLSVAPDGECKREVMKQIRTIALEAAEGSQ